MSQPEGSTPLENALQVLAVYDGDTPRLRGFVEQLAGVGDPGRGWPEKILCSAAHRMATHRAPDEG
jgi:hypothetical protein